MGTEQTPAPVAQFGADGRIAGGLASGLQADIETARKNAPGFEAAKAGAQPADGKGSPLGGAPAVPYAQGGDINVAVGITLEPLRVLLRLTNDTRIWRLGISSEEARWLAERLTEAATTLDRIEQAQKINATTTEGN